MLTPRFCFASLSAGFMRRLEWKSSTSSRLGLVGTVAGRDLVFEGGVLGGPNNDAVVVSMDGLGVGAMTLIVAGAVGAVDGAAGSISESDWVADGIGVSFLGMVMFTASSPDTASCSKSSKIFSARFLAHSFVE